MFDGPFPALMIDGQLYDRLRYGSQVSDVEQQCPECQAAQGELHGDWCQRERCPKCGELFVEIDPGELVDSNPELLDLGALIGLPKCACGDNCWLTNQGDDAPTGRHDDWWCPE